MGEGEKTLCQTQRRLGEPEMEKTPRRRSALLQLFRSILALWQPWGWPGGSEASYPPLPLPPEPLNYSPRCRALMNYGAKTWCLLATCSLLPPPAPAEPPGPSPPALCPAVGSAQSSLAGPMLPHGCSPPPGDAPKPLTAARAALRRCLLTPLYPH